MRFGSIFGTLKSIWTSNGKIKFAFVALGILVSFVYVGVCQETIMKGLWDTEFWGFFPVHIVSFFHFNKVISIGGFSVSLKRLLWWRRGRQKMHNWRKIQIRCHTRVCQEFLRFDFCSRYMKNSSHTQVLYTKCQRVNISSAQHRECHECYLLDIWVHTCVCKFFIFFFYTKQCVTIYNQLCVFILAYFISFKLDPTWNEQRHNELEVLCQYRRSQFIVNGQLEYGAAMVHLSDASHMQIGQTTCGHAFGSHVL